MNREKKEKNYFKSKCYFYIPENVAIYQSLVTVLDTTH